MQFIESYKHLEKLCSELLDSDRRISAYIDEMLNTPRGAYLVKGWDDDLKRLKHYRWVRNKITHEPGCTEQNMCKPGDAAWIDAFCSRIVNQKDPLSLFYKAAGTSQSVKLKKWHSMQTSKKCRQKKTGLKIIISIVFVICLLIIWFAVRYKIIYS